MTKKYLCICDWGNVRSVAMAQHIKNLNGKYKNHVKEGTLEYEAIAIGDMVSSSKTLNLLKLQWADYIIDTRDYLPEDIWHNPRDQDLKEKVEEIWEKELKKLSN